MFTEPPSEIEVLLVTDRSRGRELRDELAEQAGLTVESVDTSTAAETRLTDADADIDCVLTDHDPPAVDAPTVIQAAVDVALPSLVVSPESYDDLGIDPFAAGASGFHRMGDRDGSALLADRIRQTVQQDRTLRETRSLSDTLFEDLDTAIALLDTDGTLLDINQRALDFAGLDEEGTVIGESFWETPWCTRTAASAAEMQAAIGRARNGETLHFEFQARDSYYNIIDVESVLRPIEVDGTVVALLMKGADITEKRSVERRLQVLTRVLRHNLRNNLVAINGHAEFVETANTGTTADHAAAIGRVTDDLVEKSELARRVEQELSVDRRPIPTIEITSIIDSELDGLADRHPGVEIERTMPDEQYVRAENGIDVAFRALFTNAIEHNDAETPRLSVSVDLVAEQIGSGETYELDKSIDVRIRDNGPGIPDHEIEVLDEGFETELQHGSGLGLWAANWIINDSGGHLEFEDTTAGGTEAVVSLPAVESTDE